MRHQRAGRKFSRDSKSRKALFLNLSKSLIAKEQIKTTLPKAKDLRRVVEKIITKSKIDTVANRRLVAAELGNDDVSVKKLFTVLGPRYAKRAGGYTRVLHAGIRYGDAAPMAIIELVERDENAKKADVKKSEVKDVKAVSDKKTSEKSVKAPVVKAAKEFGNQSVKSSGTKKEVSVKRRSTGK